MRTAIIVLGLLMGIVPVRALTAPLVIAQASAMTPGEVRKVDKQQGKVTIRHEPIANLGMPAMTMVFRVKDPGMLEEIKEGDKIQFVAERVDGNLTVVQWQPAR